MKFTDYKNWYLRQAFEDAGDAGTGTDGDQGAADEGAGEKTYSEEEVNALIDKAIERRLARERKDAEKKTKAAEEAARLEKLTAEQKLQEKADALQKKIDELEEKEARAEMAKSARKMLSEENISIPDEIVSVLITKDADTTKDNVDAFVKVFKAAVQDGVREALKGKTPKSGSVAKTTMTKQEIEAIKDPIARQRAIRDNLALYRN
ncbi:MAG: DUF4355 domain-containing protein [Paludibacteraceae bacterium]|nr:DUF4355 domain-containing protein [Paludibacteraceae bacterium]MBQ7439120.1 DUF4355 domain-containing protein [Paludibacteraceae bacterium]